jgi:VIT1/CCC1 family predicted Fe2+/Mn2+ transporter
MLESPTATTEPTQSLLTPPERASEIVFGIIMTLSITAAVRVGGGEAEGGTRALLVAALACNVAWGMVDAAMYLINTLVERRRKARAVQELRDAPTDAAFRARLREYTPPGLMERLDDETRGRFRRWLQLHGDAVAGRLDGQDVRAALLIWLLVFAATLPLVLPFLFIGDAQTALRVSQVIAIAILFSQGLRLGRWMGVTPWKSGLGFAAAGFVIGAACIALGG